VKPAERLDGASASGSAATDLIAEAGHKWVQNWGDDATPSMIATTSIMRVQQILMARLNDILGQFDLTFPRYEALMLLYLSSRGSLPLGKIGERLQVHRTSVTNLVDGLERSGFAERRPHEHDRRMMLAVITDAGRGAAERATRALNDVRFATEPLTHGDLDAITEILRKLRADADGFPLPA
jgi:DNA-binding MarR family transcriptional regulator